MVKSAADIPLADCFASKSIGCDLFASQPAQIFGELVKKLQHSRSEFADNHPRQRAANNPDSLKYRRFQATRLLFLVSL